MDWNPLKRGKRGSGGCGYGYGGQSPMISPQGYRALVVGIEEPVPMGRLRTERRLVGVERVEVKKGVGRVGRKGWRVSGRR